MEALDWDRQGQPGAEHPFVSPPFSFETKKQKAGETSKCKSQGGILDSCPVLLLHSARHAGNFLGPSGCMSATGRPNTTATMHGLGWGERGQACLKWALKDQVWELLSGFVSLNILWSRGSKATNCQNTAQVTQGSHKETKQMAKAEFTGCTS